jgi:hypothetical protein
MNSSRKPKKPPPPQPELVKYQQFRFEMDDVLEAFVEDAARHGVQLDDSASSVLAARSECASDFAGSVRPTSS